MYLKTCWLENTGPIPKFDIQMPFYADGRPKPVIMVGSNGTGKTVMLSYVADALIEMAKKGYQDVVPGQGFTSPYFRVVSNMNRKVNTSHSVAFLSFEAYDGNAPRQLFYHEQTGETAPVEWDNICQQRFEREFSWNDGTKVVEGVNEVLAEKVFEGKSNCFFPFNRFERPHWHNPKVINSINSFDMGGNFRKQLETRPIIITETAAHNQSWLLHVFLDSRADFIPVITQENKVNFMLQDETENLLQRRISIDNITSLLREILRDQAIYLGLLSRTNGIARVCIAKDKTLIVPSLHHLSAGQAILFNMFLTIIRYADRGDTTKSTSLSEIEGIVLIDEIDAHIHSDLQHDALPKLIKLFPKVQFIVTSHAPLFVLGMEREFGSDGYLLLEMPDGNAISAERFSEFQRSFEYYQQTKAFDDEQRERLRFALEKETKPLVFTEGDTDPDYLHTALELFERVDLLSALDIKWIGTIRNGQKVFTGDKNLNNASEFLRANPKFLEKQRVLLLYDCDTSKPSLTEDKLWIRSIPYNEKNTVAKKGIENLLSPTLFDSHDRQFYSCIEKTGDYGERSFISEFNKRAFCDYICKEKRERSDFIAFEAVIAILEQFANYSL